MQNLQTGEMAELPSDYNELEGQKMQEARDRLIDREKQGPVFHVGEVIDLKGGRFKVHSIGKLGLVLHGLPGTKFQKEK